MLRIAVIGDRRDVAAEAICGRCVVSEVAAESVAIHDAVALSEYQPLRDWLRAHEDGHAEYESLKRGLAERPGSNVDECSDEKMPWISSAIARADAWARALGLRYEAGQDS